MKLAMLESENDADKALLEFWFENYVNMQGGTQSFSPRDSVVGLDLGISPDEKDWKFDKEE